MYSSRMFDKHLVTCITVSTTLPGHIFTCAAVECSISILLPELLWVPPYLVIHLYSSLKHLLCPLYVQQDVWECSNSVLVSPHHKVCKSNVIKCCDLTCRYSGVHVLKIYRFTNKRLPFITVIFLYLWLFNFWAAIHRVLIQSVFIRSFLCTCNSTFGLKYTGQQKKGYKIIY